MRHLACAAMLLVTTAAFGGITRETITSGGKTRVYYLFIPKRAADAPPAPLLLTFHGSGHNGSSLVEPWQSLAEKEGIVVAGPDAADPRQWVIPTDGPDFIRDVVEAVKTKTPIDTHRIYLFGHSAGAGFAIELALLQSEYFAAAAIHAGRIVPSNYDIFNYVKRKIPIWMCVGTRDPLFSVADVRATRDELQKRDVPVELLEIPRHDHNYYGIARQINERAWPFLAKVSLAGEPKWIQYEQP